jgi:DNA-binding transcriptional regulator YiaG
MNCQTCTTPTKYVMGLWDGANNTHGKIFSCHNLECELKLNMLRNIVITEREKGLVKDANEKNKIFMEQIKAKRKELNITIMKMSKRLGIPPSTYSNYEQYRNVLPLDIGDKIDGVFRKEKDDD